MDGPRPLESLWFQLRDRMLARRPDVDANMLEALHGAFYAGACAVIHASITNPALDWAVIHAEVEEFSKRGT